jgi:formylglycine-generating enzyme required for sulfatase activity
MGSEQGRHHDNEPPQHEVTIPQAFVVGKYPVTFAEWDAAVAAGALSHKPGDRGWGRGTRPVINVSWNDARSYVKWLSDTTGQNYRLLSEAEWEYACRAGTATAYSFGEEVRDLDRHGWYLAKSDQKTHPIGEKMANAFGLHDMHGNVWEWCEDIWHNSYKDKPENLKSTGGVWSAGGSGKRVLRGGSWNDDPQVLRSAFRFYGNPDNRNNNIGFRVARTLHS